MAKNLLVISCDVRETRVALIEDGIIAELHIERRGPHGQTSTVGNVYLGKVYWNKSRLIDFALEFKS